jgi:hypothetical protein
MMRNAVIFSLGAVALTSLALLISILVHVVVDDSGSRVLVAQTQVDHRLTQMIPSLRQDMERLHVETIGLQLHPAETYTTFTLALTGYTGDNTTFTLLPLPTIDANTVNDRWTSVLTPRGNGATLTLNPPINEVTTVVDYTIPLQVEVDGYFQKGTRSILVFQLQVAASPTEYGLQDLLTTATNAAQEVIPKLSKSKLLATTLETTVSSFVVLLIHIEYLIQLEVEGVIQTEAITNMIDLGNALVALQNNPTQDTLLAFKQASDALESVKYDALSLDVIYDTSSQFLDLEILDEVMTLRQCQKVLIHNTSDNITSYITNGLPVLTDTETHTLETSNGYTAWDTAVSVVHSFKNTLADSVMLKAVMAYAKLTQATENLNTGVHLQVVASHSKF